MYRNITANNSQSVNQSMALFMLIVNVYTIPILASVGFVLNLFCAAVLLHPRLSGDTYKYLVVKTLIHLLAQMMTSLTALTNCAACELSQTHGVQILRVIMAYLGNSASSMAALVEIFLSYHRLLMFNNIEWLPKLRFVHAVAVTVTIGFAISMPNLFATHIAQPRPNRFVGVRSLVAESVAYRVYAIAFNLGQSFVSFILMLMLNALVTTEFNKYIRKKSLLSVRSTTALSQVNSNKKKSKTGSIDMRRLSSKTISRRKATPTMLNLPESAMTQKQRQRDLAELKFTRMIIVASFCYTLTRLVQLIAAITSNIMQLQGIVNSMTVIYMTILSFSLTMIYYGSSLFFYLIFNKRIRHYFRRIFHL
jgi:hypothetical protein